MARQVALVYYTSPDLVPAGLKRVAIVTGVAPDGVRRITPNWVASPEAAPVGLVCYGAVRYAEYGLVPAGLLAFTESLGPEIIPNGGFEIAGTGGADLFSSWVEFANSGIIADELSVVHTGGHACKITAGVTQDTHVQQGINVIPGCAYILSFWTRGDGSNALWFNIWDNINSANIIAVRATPISAAVYAQVFVPFTAPAGCTSLTPAFYGAPVNGAICYLDDVSLRQVL